MNDELLEAWHTNNRINLFLLDQISDDGLRCTLSKRGGRDVARQFAHLHNVRVWHLDKRTKDLAAGLVRFEGKDSPPRRDLVAAFETSGAAVATFLTDVLAGVPGRRGFKKGVFTTLAYFVAHESHHRGNIVLTLKERGHALNKAAQYAIWGWDQM